MSNLTTSDISAFLENVPPTLDDWDKNDKLRYYQDNLESFGSLKNETQWAIVEFITISILKEFYAYFFDPMVASELRASEANSTLSFLLSVSGWLSGEFTTQSPQTTPTPDLFCAQFDNNKAYFVVLMCPAAVAVLFILSFLQTRKYLNLGCCGARPGIVIPIDFVTPGKRRWAAGAVFGTMAYGILYLFEGNFYYIPDEFKDPNFTKTYGWVKVFVMMLNVSIVCVTSYPLLACLTLRKNIIANIIGILYLCPWLVWQILLWVWCPIMYSSEDGEESRQLNYSTLLSYIFDIPIFLCYGLIYLAFFIDLIINCRKHCCDYKKKKLEMTGPYKYVTMLLEPQTSRTMTTLQRIKQRLSYSKVLGFKYSPRILCTMVVCFFTLFKLSINIDFLMMWLTEVVKRVIIDFYPFFEENNATSIFDQVLEGMDIAFVELKIAIYLSFIVHALFMVDIIIKYRHHVRKYIRGDRSWHYKFESSPASHLVGSMRYGGYQVAYMLYGWTIFAFLLFVIQMAATFLLFIPLRDGKRNFVINAIITLWPTILVSLAVYFAQLLACKFIFLQLYGRYLAFNNRRIYHIVDFFLFFYNVVLGFFSCLKRVLFSLVFGTLLISRLDRVLLMKGFERFDAGYKAYLGVLHVDIFHTHPVMKVFIQLLEKARLERQGNLLTPKLQKKRKYRNKWYRAYTLARNPIIVLERMQKELKEKQATTDIEDEIIETAGALSAGLIGVTVANGVISASDISVFPDSTEL